MKDNTRIWMFLFSTADWCTLILVLETNQTGRGLMVYVTSHHLKTELSNKIPAGDFYTRSLAAEDHQLNGKERVP